MAGSWVAVALTLVITGAPVVTTACEGICAARSIDTAAAAEHHSCHQEASTPNDEAITSATHICGHSEEGPSGVGQSLWLLAAPAVIVQSFAFAPPSPGAPLLEGGSDHGPPLVSPRFTQLRI